MSVRFSGEKKSECQVLDGRVPASLLRALDGLSSQDQLRTLPQALEGVDFHSNDYLGLARTPLDIAAFQSYIEKCGSSVGATGSRLISGNRPALEEFEEFLACFHDQEAALVFNSGFEANSALIGSLGTRKAVFLYDEYVHASIREGLRVGFSRSYSFRHNDLENLQQLLKRNPGDELYVVVESVYSMDGDVSPLLQIARLCETYNAFLLVDEAHTTGVYGDSGEGLVQALDLSHAVFARVHTFGKAVGFRGACIVGTQSLIDYIVNKGRPFIYSTAPDLFSIWWAKELYQRMITCKHERASLFKMSRYFHQKFEKLLTTQPFKTTSAERAAPFALIFNESPIQGVLCPGNRAVLSLEKFLRKKGFGVKAIRSPTVPSGKERIRISLHSFNTETEVDSLIESLLDARRGGVIEDSYDGE